MFVNTCPPLTKLSGSAHAIWQTLKCNLYVIRRILYAKMVTDCLQSRLIVLVLCHPFSLHTLKAGGDFN